MLLSLLWTWLRFAGKAETKLKRYEATTTVDTLLKCMVVDKLMLL